MVLPLMLPETHCLETKFMVPKFWTYARRWRLLASHIKALVCSHTSGLRELSIICRTMLMLILKRLSEPEEGRPVVKFRMLAGGVLSPCECLLQRTQLLYPIFCIFYA